MDRKTFIKNAGLGLGLASLQVLNRRTTGKVPTSGDPLQAKVVRADEGSVLNVIGDVQTHKISGSDTDNQIVEWVNNVDPGVGIPPHIHTKEDEIFRVLKGQVEIMVGEKKTILNPGDIAFAPKNVVHAWKVIGNEKASMSTSAFPAGIEHLFQELSALPPGPPDFEKVARICANHGINFV